MGVMRIIKKYDSGEFLNGVELKEDMYQLLDPNGFDHAGEYVTLSDGNREIKEYLMTRMERATSIMKIIQNGESRIYVRKSYMGNPKWQYLYPHFCRDNVTANLKTGLALKRLHKAYIKTINDIIEINNNMCNEY